MFLFQIRTALVFIAILIAGPSFAKAMEYSFRADDQAPIGVMGEHTPERRAHALIQVYVHADERYEKWHQRYKQPGSVRAVYGNANRYGHANAYVWCYVCRDRQAYFNEHDPLRKKIHGPFNKGRGKV